MTARTMLVRGAAVLLLGLAAAAPLLLPGRDVQGEKETGAAPSFTFAVLFSDADGLKPGHPVTYHGVPIGEVARLELTPADRVRVTVRLEEAHRARVRGNATARVVQDGLVSVTGERALELVNGESGGAPIAAGAEIEGVDSWAGLQVWRARTGGSEWAGAAKEKAVGWVAWLRGTRSGE